MEAIFLAVNHRSTEASSVVAEQKQHQPTHLAIAIFAQPRVGRACEPHHWRQSPHEVAGGSESDADQASWRVEAEGDVQSCYIAHDRFVIVSTSVRSDPRTVCLAFGSVTEKPIRAEKQGRTIWHAAKPGLEYRDVPDAPAVAGSRATRLTQLRNIARQFSAVLVYGDQGTEELRFLPQPLHRYPGDDPAIKDGAVFAFVTGTDPEAILQIEAVAGDSDSLRWRYAVTRRTSGALRVSHNDKVIWTCSTTEGAFDEPFFICVAR